jgi:hypothetical protein
MAIKKQGLSKSTFIRGLQCHKSLYLHKKRYFLRDRLSPEQLARFKRGTNVGVLARSLFPGGIDVSPPTHFQYARSIEQTQQLIDQKFPVIYEAAFKYDGVLVALDILEYRDGKWYAYEVKSSLAVSDTYLYDAALQYYVIQGSGLELADISIVYMNRDFVLRGHPDLTQLFNSKSVLNEVRALQVWIRIEVSAQFKVLELQKSPDIKIGPHCNQPYPCDFQGHCWKHIPKNSVFRLNWLSKDQQFELYIKRILMPENIPDDYFSEQDQHIKLTAHKAQVSHMDVPFIRNYLRDINIPVCFIKIWYHRPAIPAFHETHPYEPLPFFIGIAFHSGDENELALNHRFIGTGENPFVVCYNFINTYLDLCSSIITYNDPYFYSLLQKTTKAKLLKNSLPFFDLHNLVHQNHYYNPNTWGQSDLFTLGRLFLQNDAIEDTLFNSETEASLIYTGLNTNTSLPIGFEDKMINTTNHLLRSIAGFYNQLKEITG